MGPLSMVVCIILIVTIGRVLTARYRRHDGGATTPVESADAMRLRGEVQQLRERVQVLERVITDNHGSADLDRQIEQLRDR